LKGKFNEESVDIVNIGFAVTQRKFDQDIKPILRKKGLAIGAIIVTQIEQNGFIFAKNDNGSDCLTFLPNLSKKNFSCMSYYQL
jgi:hypothetical protein